MGPFFEEQTFNKYKQFDWKSQAFFEDNYHFLTLLPLNGQTI